MIDVKQRVTDLWKMVYAAGTGNAQMGLNMLSCLFILREFDERSRMQQAGRRFGSDLPQAFCWRELKTLAEHDPEACYRAMSQAAEWLQALDPESCLVETIVPYSLSLLIPVWINISWMLSMTCMGTPGSKGKPLRKSFPQPGSKGRFHRQPVSYDLCISPGSWSI